jgi:hypothetical protein
MALPKQTRTFRPKRKLDQSEFNQLTDLLYETYKGNAQRCSEALGITRPTWKKWEHTPPTWPYWNLVLRHVIKQALSHLDNIGGITNRHRQRVQDALSRIPSSESMLLEAEALSYNYKGAEAHLRALLSKKGMYWDQIKLAANSGGYSHSALRVASARSNIVKTSEGYGSNKRSYWRLPDQDD